jgi:glycosyltransferase involved in cell wall biosynthesis
MRIAYIAAGAADMICGNCLRDNRLARAVIALGHELVLVPTYTPIRTDEINISHERVFYGGINVYLQQKFPFFQYAPGVVGWLLDRPALLRWVSRFALKTQPHDLGALTVSVLQGSEGRQKKELAKLTEWLKSWEPDVVHLTNSMFAGFAPAIKEALGKPVCCSLQGEDYFLSNLPEPYRRQAFEALKAMAPHVDTFLAPSRDQAESMAPYLGVPASEIPVVMPGIDVEDFSERTERNPDEFVVGYLARVAPEKGLHVLARALQIIGKRRGDTGPRIRLRAAGWMAPEHRPYVEDVANDPELRGSGVDFEYLGTIGRDRKIEFLRSLDVLSVPVAYRSPKGVYVLEALACGVPFVQPRSGVFPEILAETGGGLLFEPDDPEDLARAMERLIDDPLLARQMGEAGRRAVQQKFHSRRMAEQTLVVYDQMTAKPAQTYGV